MVLSDTPVTEVTNNSEQNRFELRLNGDLVGILGYFEVGQFGQGKNKMPIVGFMHTVITEDFGHRGLARALVEASLEAARANGWKVRPVCSYVQRYLASTTEFSDLVTT